MKTEVAWMELIPSKEHFENTVFDIAFSPDGANVLVAVGNRILVFDAQHGDLMHSLKGHRDYVYAVAYSRDGKRFASGGKDKTIIIWTSACEGILKYSHTDSIQCLAYNPVTQQLASATASDFGLWSPEQKSVQKYKISAKALCASWTNDGQYLAIGQFNGRVSVRDKQGNEKVRITRQEPIWCLSWSPLRQDSPDVLVVGCWDQTLSFYLLSGSSLWKERNLGYDPCSLCFYGDGEYLMVGGSDRKVTMYTHDGVMLKTVAERDSWVWAVRARPKHKYICVGCNDGTVGMYRTVFSTVHGLYQDRYAHRDTMTDVIIQHLITEQKVRIKTRDYVKKIAVYRARLAVQLPDRVLVYETVNIKEPYDMHYRLKEKIHKALDCNLLVVTAEHIILCQEKRLQLYNFKGRKMREWILEAVIRYIRVVGGPVGREGLLVGLKNGAVFKIFIDNRFPVKLIQHEAPVRCLDLSASRKKLAVVDENSKVFVYDLLTKELLFEESNANSVAWNTDMEEMLCYSGNGQLSIKTGDFPIHKQPLQGFVVGFKGSKIFCLHYLSMQTIDVPQSASLMRYLEQKDYLHAYQVACLGVTESDWRELANQALVGLSFDIARKAYIRIRDVRYIELLNRIEIGRRSPGHDDEIFKADILAFQGKYEQAATLYCRRGQRKKAIEMYLDLRNWNKAKEYVEGIQGDDDVAGPAGSGVSMLELLRRQATWLRETNELKAAAEMYWAAKDYDTAIEIWGDNKWMDDLMAKVRTMNKLQREQLEAAAGWFRKLGHHQFAIETYLKMDDTKSLIELYVELRQWDQAFELLKDRPDLKVDLYQPYAEWLALTDRFDEARVALQDAGNPDDALRMLRQLTLNAVTENRFKDAGYYYWLLAQECLNGIQDQSYHTSYDYSPQDKKRFSEFKKYRSIAQVYYAYDDIYRYIDEPFTGLLPEAIFQTATFILNKTRDSTPLGVSKAYSFFSLAKQGKLLGAFKLARQCYKKLLSLKIPKEWRDQIDLANLTIRTAAYQNKEGIRPICYRCSTSNPLLNNNGDFCVNCNHPFLRSFCAFETLPLVEFQLEHDIEEKEALDLLEMDAGDEVKKQQDSDDEYGSANVLRLGQESDDEDNTNDKFHYQLMHSQQNMDGSWPPIVVDRETLKKMNRPEVFVRKWKAPGQSARYFRSIVPEFPINMCDNCQHFFHEEDFEFQVLQKKKCPFCRVAIKLDDAEDELDQSTASIGGAAGGFGSRR